MKTAELTGGILDYWVAKSEGLQCHMRGSKCWVVNQVFEPSTDWMEGGPIIEREDYLLPYKTPPHYWHLGKYSSRTAGGFEYSGQTPLIAAMRAKVAMGYGAEVPDIESN